MSALPRGRLCLWSSAAQTDGVRCALLHPGGRGIRERARVYFAQAGESLRLMSAWRIAEAARTLPLASGEKKEVVVRSLASRRTRHPRARSGLFCAGWGVVATHVGLEDCRGCARTVPRIRRKEGGCGALSCIQADEASERALGSAVRTVSHPEKRRRLWCALLHPGGRGIQERARVYFAQAGESLRLWLAWRIASAAHTLPPASGEKKEVVVRSLASRWGRHPESARVFLRRLGSRCDSYRLGGLQRLRAHCPSHPEKRRRLWCALLHPGGRRIQERARVYFAQAGEFATLGLEDCIGCTHCPSHPEKRRRL